MTSADKPLYTSAPTKKSIGNAYHIYADRVELICRFPFVTKKLVIQKDDLITIDTFRPPVLRTTWRALKLDLADLKEHVGIVRRKGFFKQLRFTPENPKAFVSKTRELFGLTDS